VSEKTNIKPQTKEITMTRYEEMLSYLVDYIQRISDEYYAEHLSNLTPCKILVKKGRRFDKIIKADVDGTSKSVHCFVEKKTGKIWKSASWKQPALNYSRADLYDYKSIVNGIGMHGVRY
jgi:hypothetical protein